MKRTNININCCLIAVLIYASLFVMGVSFFHKPDDEYFTTIILGFAFSGIIGGSVGELIYRLKAEGVKKEG